MLKNKTEAAPVVAAINHELLSREMRELEKREQEKRDWHDRKRLANGLAKSLAVTLDDYLWTHPDAMRALLKAERDIRDAMDRQDSLRFDIVSRIIGGVAK